MSGWTATVWTEDERHWHARYTNGAVMLCDGPAVPWVDHARSREKIEKKARSMLAHLTPGPPLIQFEMVHQI